MPISGNRDHYDPQQPRVPKGYSGGGRWTDGDDHGEASKPTDDRSRDNDASSEPFLDRESGAVVRSEYATPGSKEWDERHTATLRDGTSISYETSGPHSRVYENGKLIGVVKWTASGPVAEPFAQLAYAEPPRPPGQIANRFAAALAVYRALLARTRDWRQGGEVVALAYDVQALRGANRGEGPVPLARSLKKEDVERMCEKFAEIQGKLNQAYADARPDDPKWTPQTLGTDVHSRLAHAVNGTIFDEKTGKLRFRMPDEIDPNDPRSTFAEFSIQQALEDNPNLTRKEAVAQRKARYAAGGTVRLDVYEDVRREGKLICVYDPKIGTSGLSPRRILEIGQAVAEYKPTAEQIVIMEMRPNR